MATHYVSSPFDNYMALFPSFEKLPRVGFGGFFLGTNHSRRLASPLTHTWLIESEFLPCLSHLVMIERGEGGTASPTSTIL